MFSSTQILAASVSGLSRMIEPSYLSSKSMIASYAFSDRLDCSSLTLNTRLGSLLYLCHAFRQTPQLAVQTGVLVNALDFPSPTAARRNVVAVFVVAGGRDVLETATYDSFLNLVEDGPQVVAAVGAASWLEKLVRSDGCVVFEA